MSHSYRDLLVWQKSIQMVTDLYRATQKFPKRETYGLAGQVRRAAVSVASNIAEGQGRLTRGEFRSFLGQARGSLLEMETQLLIAHNLRYIDQPTFDALLNESGEVSRMLHGLIQSISPKCADDND